MLGCSIEMLGLPSSTVVTLRILRSPFLVA